MTLTEKQKYEIVIKNEQKLSIKKIAKDMNINKNTVERWINRYKDNNNINRKYGSGRKKNIIDIKDTIIIDEIKKNNNITVREVKTIFDSKNIKISTGAIYNRIKNNNFIYKNPINKPLLTEKHKQCRLEWGQKYKDFNWNNIIFSDETMKRMEGYNKKVWAKKGEIIINKTKKYPLKKNIWGCFMKNKIGPIHIFSDNMDSNKYVLILQENLVPFYDFIKRTNADIYFQQDNDPKHTAKITIAYLSEKNINTILWPSNSPDLNPIENLWYILKCKIDKKKSTNVEEFNNHIKEEWNNIDINIVNNLIDSMPTRIVNLIKNNGDYIMY